MACEVKELKFIVRTQRDKLKASFIRKLEISSSPEKTTNEG